MNIRDQLEDLQDKLKALQDQIKDARLWITQVDELKDLFDELADCRRNGTRAEAAEKFAEIEAFVLKMEDTSLDDFSEAVQACLDILE